MRKTKHLHLKVPLLNQIINTHTQYKENENKPTFTLDFWISLNTYSHCNRHYNWHFFSLMKLIHKRANVSRIWSSNITDSYWCSLLNAVWVVLCFPAYDHSSTSDTCKTTNSNTGEELNTMVASRHSSWIGDWCLLPVTPHITGISDHR